jgi:hypothetical protein
MIGLEEAVSKARSFLVSQAGLGPLFLYLEEGGPREGALEREV